MIYFTNQISFQQSTGGVHQLYPLAHEHHLRLAFMTYLWTVVSYITSYFSPSLYVKAGEKWRHENRPKPPQDNYTASMKSTTNWDQTFLTSLASKTSLFKIFQQQSSLTDENGEDVTSPLKGCVFVFSR